MPGAYLVPGAVQFDGALLVLDPGLGVPLGVPIRAAAIESHEAEAVGAHHLGRTPAPAPVKKKEIADLVLAHGIPARHANQPIAPFNVHPASPERRGASP